MPLTAWNRRETTNASKIGARRGCWLEGLNGGGSGERQIGAGRGTGIRIEHYQAKMFTDCAPERDVFGSLVRFPRSLGLLFPRLLPPPADGVNQPFHPLSPPPLVFLRPSLRYSLPYFPFEREKRQPHQAASVQIGTWTTRSLLLLLVLLVLSLSLSLASRRGGNEGRRWRG